MTSRPFIPIGSFENKMLAEQAAVALSNLAPNGQAMVFKACKVKNVEGRSPHAIIRVQ